MSQLYIVGTAHNPADDLESVVRSIRPKQLLLEIVDEDLTQEHLEDQLPEMVEMYHFAKRQGIIARGFDARVDIIIPTVTDEDLLYADRVARKHSTLGFRELNKRQYDAVWETIAKMVINSEAHAQRQDAMVENIRQMRIPGENLLFCGIGHLQYLERNIPDAIFPFR